MVWEKRKRVSGRHRDRGDGKRRQALEEKEYSQRKKTEGGKKEEGNVERGEKELTSCPPAQAAREEEGTNPLTVFLPPPPFGFGGETGAEVGCFSNLPCLSTSRDLREWRLQGPGSSVPQLAETPALLFNTYSSPPPQGVSVCTKQIHRVFYTAAGNPSGPLLPTIPEMRLVGEMILALIPSPSTFHLLELSWTQK